MKSLFTKIFVSFWLAQVLFLALMFLTAARPMATQQALARRRQLTQDSLTVNAQNAIALLDRGQREAAERYFANIKQAVHFSVVLYDAQGHELVGEQPSPAARQFAAKVFQSGGPQFIDIGPNTLAGHEEAGSDGKTYYVVSETHRGPFDALDRVSSLAFWPLMVWVVASGAVCFWLARYLTRPVVRLRAASQQLAAGDLSARAGGSLAIGQGELADLVNDFDRMAERMQLLVDSQNQLLSDVSHELRSPLARLSVAIGVARRRATGEITPTLDRIEREAERLNELIGRVLTLCRMEAGEHGWDTATPLDLTALVTEVVTDANFEAQARNCQVVFTPGEACTTMGHAELLRSAIENVVRNALRYTAPGTEVKVSVTCQTKGANPTATIAVRDHGDGIAEDQLAEIFRPFVRLDDSRERQTGGSGLGLAITERALRLHGGSVRARNAPAGGLLVELTLPAQATAAPAEKDEAAPSVEPAAMGQQ